MPLSLTGYTKPTFEELVAAIKDYIWTSPFGVAQNLEPESVGGQLVLVFAKFLGDMYDDIEDTYNWQSPANASGVPLANIGEATNSFFKEATKGEGTLTIFGTLGTAIAIGDLTVSVSGDSTSTFINTAAATVAAGTDAIQTITFSTVPDAGNWSLTFEGETTSTMAFGDVAATVQTNLNALSVLSAVTVAGNYTTGFIITFAGVDGSQAQEAIHYTTNTLETVSVAVSITITQTTTGVLPNVDVAIEAVTAGNIPAYAGTLTVIETPISGIDSCTNALDITQGTDIETDAEFRARRTLSLANPGKGTVDSIYAHLIALTDVTDARVYENDTDTADAYGRPPSSLHAVVVGGTDAEIIDIIGDDKPAGTRTFGVTSGTYTSAQDQAFTLYFDRPTSIPIYITMTITVDPDTFPVDGAASVKTALADYGDENFGIGQDVIHYKLYKPLEDIVGIVSIVMYIGFVSPATLAVNLTIADNEVSFFDTTNISLTVV